MANKLTGGYDAVVEVSVKTINTILATLHQNGASEDASPSFLHSFALRVGDPPKIALPDFVELSYWLSVMSQSSGGRSNKEISDKVPPGASADLDEQTKTMAEAQAELTNPLTVRGTAQVQLSTPTVSFPQGSTSEVTAHLRMRAHYLPDPNTLALPKPVHGEVRITFSVKPKSLRGKKRVLDVQIPDDDNKIQFTAASGTLKPADADKIEQHIRKVLRQAFEPFNAPLPKDFQFNQFKALGSGSNQALALPIQLSDDPPPAASDINDINLSLNSGDAFAICVSKEYILSLIQESLDTLKATHPQFTVPKPWWVPGSEDATYTVTYSVANAGWSNGKITIDIHGDAKNSRYWAPNLESFEVHQDLALQFKAATQPIKVVPVGEPWVNVHASGWFSGLVESLAEPKVRKAFKTARNEALNEAQSKITTALTSGGNINDALAPFDDSADAKYTALETNTDGLILRGSIATKARPWGAIEFIKTGDGTGFTALKTWIPAGTIEEYEWRWGKMHPLVANPFMDFQTVSDKHSFVLPLSEEPPYGSRVCLKVKGTQVVSIPGPPPKQVSFDYCEFYLPGFRIPPLGGVVAVPIWLSDNLSDAISMDDAIAAHVDIAAHPRRPSQAGANTVVHFPDLRRGAPVEELVRVMSEVRRQDAPLALVLVLPRGTFGNGQAAVAEQVGSLGEDFPDSVTITEDYEEEWTRLFAADRTPATYLMNARGEFVWQHVGKLNAKSFAAALDEHLISGPPPRPEPLRLAVEPGDRAPDVLLEVDEGYRLALRKFRGRPVLLNFWQSWSAPCIKELCRLQRLQEKSDEDGPAIVVINGGEAPERIAEVKREHNLTLMLVNDPKRRIARHYGVYCWPTTVSINAEGIVDDVRFGVTGTPPRSAAR